jgi:hypothetical protein
MALEFALDEHQSRAFRMVRPGVVCTFPLGRGSGKTFLARALIHTGGLNQPGAHVGLIMPSLKQARQVFWPALLEDFEGPLRGALRGAPNKTELTVTYRNGSRFTTWGTENAGGIRGQRFTRIIQDETDLIDPSVEHAVITPTFSRVGRNFEHAKFGTPLRGRYGSLYSTYSLIAKGEPGFDGFRLRSDESPQVDQEWLARIKATTPKAIYEREYNCNFESGEGLVYDFDEDFHVRVPEPHLRFSAHLVGVDHGWTDAGVFLLIGIAGHGLDATAWVLREIYVPEKPGSWWDEQATQFQGAQFWCDPSRPDRIKDLMSRGGVTARGADNDIAAGVARVAEMLFRRETEAGPFARLYVHPDCVNTIREFKSYRRRKDPKQADRFTDDIEDRNNHAMDALRYAIVMRFGRLSTGKTIVSGA